MRMAVRGVSLRERAIAMAVVQVSLGRGGALHRRATLPHGARYAGECAVGAGQGRLGEVAAGP